MPHLLTRLRGKLSGSKASTLSLALVGFVFAVDLCLPLGVASAVPYTFAVLLALKAKPGWFAPAVAGLCGVLTVAKMGIVPDRGTTELWKVIVNRCLALFAVGMTTFLGVLRRRAEADRLAAEERIREHLADLAHMDRVKTAGQLAAGLAHELNQPLAAVCLQAELASRLGPTDQPELADALREISDQSHRAADIIRTLRRMVRRDDPAQDPVDLNEVARTVARVIDWQARRAGVEVRLLLADDPPPPPVLGDRVQLEQVAFNLLQNAIDALTETAAGPKIAQVETAAAGADRVTLTVRDTGPGLPPGGAGRVFERFYTTKPNGVGMGLAISRSIVEAHGGELYLSPTVGGGAAFTVALPVPGGE